jgi:hypothetical protein
MFGLFGLFNYLLAVARAKADLPVRSVSEGGLACRSICEGGFNYFIKLWMFNRAAVNFEKWRALPSIFHLNYI